LAWIEIAKREAAKKAAENVQDGEVIGLGSGSTSAYFIQIIGSYLNSGKVNEIFGVPTSHQAAAEAIKVGIPLTSLNEHPELSLSVDGADQVDKKLNAIKGNGGALFREKIIASASRKYVLILDSRKLESTIGKDCSVPIEVLPFAFEVVKRKVENLGGKVVLREGSGKLGPVITDNGNFLIDANFGQIKDPQKLNRNLKDIPGILETGLFLDLVDVAYVGLEKGIKQLYKNGEKK
jgi:ribose 5-phosphate isomerase A